MVHEPLITGDLAEIEAVVGREAAAKIAGELAGRVLCIPDPEAPYDGPLPDVLGEIADVAGRPVALALAGAFGGTRIYVPGVGRRIGDPNRRTSEALRRVVGDEALRRISDRFGNLTIPVPRIAALSPQAARGKRVRQLIAEGVSIAVIAHQAGISERQVYRIAARMNDGRSPTQRVSAMAITRFVRRLLAEGESAGRIAARTGLSPEAVQAYVTRERRRGGPSTTKEL